MERSEYDRMAAVEETMWWYRALHDRFVERLQRLQLQPGATVLDAGCGTGGLLLRLTRDLPQFLYTGLDYDAAAVRIAEAKTGAMIQCGSVNALPFPADHFDAILSADVLCHAQVDELEAMSEFQRCLRSGKSLLLNLPAYNWMKSSHDRHVHNVRRYTATSVRKLAESTGFRVSGIGYWNSLLFPLLMIYRLTAGRRGTTSNVRAFPGWQDRLFYAVTSVERRSAHRGLRLPYGASVWAWAVKL